MKPKARWDTVKLVDDMAERGWNSGELGRVAKVHEATVSRFLNGHYQTATVAAKLAKALGYTARRYLIRSSPEQAA